MSRELPRLERGGRLKEGALKSALNEEGQQEAPRPGSQDLRTGFVWVK